MCGRQCWPADDWSKVTAGSADSGVIHVVNDKRCVDASEIDAGSTSFEPENVRLAQEGDADLSCTDVEEDADRMTQLEGDGEIF